MVSGVSKAGASIYTSDAANNPVDALFRAAIDELPLRAQLADGSSPETLMDALYASAKMNNQESIEVLHNLALGRGEIAGRAQDMLCRIICREDDATHDAALSVRQGCQSVLDGEIGAELERTANDTPAWLFAASSMIPGDGSRFADFIPESVRDKVKNYNKKAVKALWFTANSSGVFDGNVNYESIALNNDKLLYSVRDDGACLFRAAYALSNKCSSWARDADKATLLNEIKYRHHDLLIVEAIKSSFLYMKEEACLAIPSRLDAFFREKDYAEKIYQSTIASGEFTLYSPIGLGNAIDQNIAPDLHNVRSSVR